MTSLFEALERREHGLPEKIRELMSRVFARMWPDSEEEMTILTHCLTWPAFPRYLKFACEYK